MKLNDAIAHAKEVAEKSKKNAEHIREVMSSEIALSNAVEYEGCATEHEQLAAWLTELQERREADKWVSVKERMPEDFCVVLVYCPQFDNVHCVFRECGAWHRFSCDDVLMEAVTHWRPLPKAPEKEEK